MLNKVGLTIQEFVEEVRSGMEELYKDGYTICTDEVTKNNGVRILGVRVRKGNESICPVIYMDALYEEYRHGSAISDIVNKAAEYYEEQVEKTSIDVQSIADFAYVRDRVCFRLFNAEMNKDLLADIPHIKYLDLVVAFHVYLWETDGNSGSVLVTNQLLKLWDGVTVETLVQFARSNTQRILGEALFPMEELIHKFCKEFPDIENDVFGGVSDWFEPHILVGTNRFHVFGANVILNKCWLESAAQKIGGDFYILPASVHEVLLLPVTIDFGVDELRDMVRAINGNKDVLPKTDILSDNIYLFHSEKGYIEILSN